MVLNSFTYELNNFQRQSLRHKSLTKEETKVPWLPGCVAGRDTISGEVRVQNCYYTVNSYYFSRILLIFGSSPKHN